jgi:hypothetical protein
MTATLFGYRRNSSICQPRPFDVYHETKIGSAPRAER